MDSTALQYAALPIFLFVAVTVGMAVSMQVLGGLIGPSRRSAAKDMPYESGMDPIHHTRRRFDIRFHLVAIAFLVFDVELLFLYPWAVATRPAPLKPERPVAVATQTSAEAPLPVQRVVDEKPAPATKTEAKVVETKSTEVRATDVKTSPAKPKAPAKAVSMGVQGAVDRGEVESRGLVFGGAMVFFALLTVGLVYDWRKGVFQWR